MCARARQISLLFQFYSRERKITMEKKRASEQMSENSCSFLLLFFFLQSTPLAIVPCSLEFFGVEPSFELSPMQTFLRFCVMMNRCYTV